MRMRKADQVEVHVHSALRAAPNIEAYVSLVSPARRSRLYWVPIFGVFNCAEKAGRWRMSHGFVDRKRAILVRGVLAKQSLRQSRSRITVLQQIPVYEHVELTYSHQPEHVQISRGLG